MTENAGIGIRAATAADLPALVAMRDDLNALERAGCPHASIQRLDLAAFTALWGATLEDPTHCWRIVEKENQPIGFGLIYLTPKSRPAGAFVHWAFVNPLHRRLGLGNILVDHLVAWAREHGAGHIELQFIEGNAIAERFWAKMGFRPYARKCVLYLEPKAQG